VPGAKFWLRSPPAAPLIESETKEHYPALDGLRAIAILFVMATHASPHLAPGGKVGVDMFFVLSGFLITGVLLRPQNSLRFFYVRRVQRLFPALLCTVALSYFLWPYTNPVSRFLPSALKAIFYVTNISQMHGSMLGCLGHTWSLSAEEQFYALWPLALFAIPALRTNWKAIGGLILCAVVGRIALLHSVPALVGYFSPLVRVDELLTGAALSVAGASLLTIGKLAPLSALGAIAFCLSYSGSWATSATVVIPVVSFGTATIIATCVTPSQSLLKTVLSTRPFVWIGKRSYGIYLYHMPIFFSLGRSLEPYGLAISALVPSAVTIVIAHISYTFIEQPILSVRFGQGGTLRRTRS
jgi:peptidoglycan/LPS O-acetylase OafA/YrhL